MRQMLRSISIVCGLVCAVWASPAHAQVAADQKAAAEALFDQGLTLLKQGDYARACTYLEQSQSIERGIGTMLYLAECYERLGRTASAWATFREASSAAQAEGQIERAQQGAARAAQLEPQLAKLTIVVPRASQVPGLEVLRNGQPVASSLWALSLPVDPGAQRVEARAAGYEPWSHSENVAARGTLSVNVPELTVLAATPQPVAAAPAAGEAPPPVGLALEAAEPESSPGSGQRIAAWLTGGAGVVALGVGTFFGVRAASENNDAHDLCPNRECRSAAYDVHKSAQDNATFANIFVIGGTALVATGVILYLTAPSGERAEAVLRLQPTASGVELRGGF